MHTTFCYSAELYDPRQGEWLDADFQIEVDGYRYTCDDFPGEVFYEVGDCRIVDIKIAGADLSASEALYYHALISEELKDDIRQAADAALNNY